MTLTFGPSLPTLVMGRKPSRREREVVSLFTGCAATRPVGDVAFGAGDAYLGHELSGGDPLATAAGAAGDVLLSEGLHYAARKQAEKAYAIGYDNYHEIPTDRGIGGRFLSSKLCGCCCDFFELVNKPIATRGYRHCEPLLVSLPENNAC